jgi:O-methyltransferase involved in polyketide biosynthesis
MEGVTQYLEAAAVENIFRYLSKTVASGSRVVFSYVHRGIIEGDPEFEDSMNLMVYLKRLGETWEFGMGPDEILSFLDGFGLEIVEHLDASKIEKRYLEPLGRQMNVFPGEYVVLAEKRFH